MSRKVLRDDKLFASLVLLILGGSFLTVGILIFKLGPPSFEREAERLAGFRPVEATVLSDLRSGREVLVEGRISAENRILHYSFVAYNIEDREVDSDGDESWVWRSAETPPLLLELADGPVEIEAGYRLNAAQTSRREGEVRYSGLETGDPVIAVGVLTSQVEPPQIAAEFIAYGTQASYIASVRRQALFGRIFGLVFALIGLGLLVGGVMNVRGAWRR